MLTELFILTEITILSLLKWLLINSASERGVLINVETRFPRLQESFTYRLPFSHVNEDLVSDETK